MANSKSTEDKPKRTTRQLVASANYILIKYIWFRVKNTTSPKALFEWIGLPAAKYSNIIAASYYERNAINGSHMSLLDGIVENYMRKHSINNFFFQMDESIKQVLSANEFLDIGYSELSSESDWENAIATYDSATYDSKCRAKWKTLVEKINERIDSALTAIGGKIKKKDMPPLTTFEKIILSIRNYDINADNKTINEIRGKIALLESKYRKIIIANKPKGGNKQVINWNGYVQALEEHSKAMSALYLVDSLTEKKD